MEIYMELKPNMFKKILPVPLTLITTIDKQEIVNAAPYGCVMPILRPLDLIAIASAHVRDTLKNIRETQEFVVNVMGEDDFKKTIKCAKNFPPHINELDAVEIESLPSKMVKPPRVKNGIGWIEAKLDREIQGENYSIIIGKVVCAEINDRYVQDDELIQDPLVMLMSGFRKIGERVALQREFIDDLKAIKF